MTSFLPDLKEFPNFLSNKIAFSEETNKISTPETFYRCGICQSRFFHLTSFIVCCGNHLPFSINLTDNNKNTTENRVFTCKICGKTFVRRQTYRDHLIGHKNPLIKCCTICSTQFSSGIIASKHKKKFHPELYEQELQKKATERAKRGKLKTHHIKNEQEKPQIKHFRIILSRMALDGFVKNDWIYLPKESVEDMKKNYEIKSEEISNDNKNLSDSVLLEAKRSSTLFNSEEISDFSEFSETIFNVYEERRSKKIKENTKKCDIQDDSMENFTEISENSKPEESKSTFDCKICGKTFKEAQTKNLHIRRVHKQIFEGQIFCHYCGKDFMGKGYLLSHFRNVHFDENGVFRETSNSRKSKKIDNNRNKDKQSFVCEICGEVKETKGTMMKHRHEKHGVLDPEYKIILQKDYEENVCPHCGKPFTSIRKFKDHEKYHLREQPNLFCTVCGIKCKTDIFLRAHMQRHNEKTFFCKFEGCRKGFAVKYDYLTHIKRAHGSGESFPCKRCDQVFRTWKLRRSHEEVEHGIVKVKLQRNKRITPNASYKEDEGGNCRFCGKHFDKNSYRKLQNHEYHHKKIIPNLHCEICGAKSTTEYNLKRHMERHGDIKYYCQYPGCGKGYKVKHDIRIHARRAHKDVKEPFS
ncbi:endothelial zinc finger protein induced by tumor necrosis factor alpha-like [Culicoides brevitarsis]|uniref:endothelial zinc finger protein induced by tumor necrosis factor alpha-like n=1 Tax=Culicoides brevitarsis TaxID=469753 RepID=UPI00307C1DBE